MAGSNHTKMSGKQRVPLDLFLSGMLNGSLGEKDHPVIVVDESKRRSFAGHRPTPYRSLSNSSFCSSVTSGSLDSSQAALVVSRWDSMPSSGNRDTKLRAPARESTLSLRRPARTRTNDLKKPAATRKQAPKAFRSPIRRKSHSMRCDSHSKRSKERVAASLRPASI